jgi:5-methylcytosine-specific restriction endonuclease McrA
LHAAQIEAQADVELKKLARLRQQPERDVALAELRRLAQQQREEERRRLPVRATARRESVPVNIRALLKAVHDGKCQLCGFTFRKRDGDPYFEIHHIEGTKGNQLWNLLVVCPNCHAQFEHADVGRFEKRGNWIVAVTINGERKEVYQPLLGQPTDALLQAARLSCLLLAVSHLCLSHWRAV